MARWNKNEAMVRYYNINGVRVVDHMEATSADTNRAFDFIRNFNSDGSSDIAGAPICEAHIYKNECIVYASGYYFCRMGLIRIHTMDFNKRHMR